MSAKKIPFTNEYIKEQESTLSLGYKLFLIMGAVVAVVGIALSITSRGADPIRLITLGMIYLVWGALSKQRLNTFRENLELSRKIEQLRDGK